MTSEEQCPLSPWQATEESMVCICHVWNTQQVMDTQDKLLQSQEGPTEGHCQCLGHMCRDTHPFGSSTAMPAAQGQCPSVGWWWSWCQGQCPHLLQLPACWLGLLRVVQASPNPLGCVPGPMWLSLHLFLWSHLSQILHSCMHSIPGTRPTFQKLLCGPGELAQWLRVLGLLLKT